MGWASPPSQWRAPTGRAVCEINRIARPFRHR